MSGTFGLCNPFAFLVTERLERIVLRAGSIVIHPSTDPESQITTTASSATPIAISASRRSRQFAACVERKGGGGPSNFETRWITGPAVHPRRPRAAKLFRT